MFFKVYRIYLPNVYSVRQYTNFVLNRYPYHYPFDLLEQVQYAFSNFLKVGNVSYSAREVLIQSGVVMYYLPKKWGLLSQVA